MQKRILALLFVFIFLFAQVSDVYAKGWSGGRSSRSSSFSSSKRSSGISSSKSYSGSSSSKKSSSGYSGSSSSKKNSSGSSGSSGSYSGSGSSSSTSSSSSSASSKLNSSKKTYMQDAYKKQASTKKYNATLNTEQQKVKNSTMNKNYTVSNRMSLEDALRTRPQRITVYNSRPIFVNVNTHYFGSSFSYGYASVGPWDLWFLLRASDMFWYNHWNDIYAYRSYFDAAQFAQMEARVRALEAQNIARNSDYMDPDVDPDLQFSSDYQQSHLDNIYYSNRYPSRSGNPFITFIIIIIIIIVLIIIIRKVSKPKRPKGNYSRIY
ncbi:MAG: hypothetical protein Q8942_05060 [Bacillota bacterium]|nr:hypothetical protein [Bacillota bacterium]